MQTTGKRRSRYSLYTKSCENTVISTPCIHVFNIHINNTVQALVDEKTVLQREKIQLETSEANLKSQVAELGSSLVQLQDELKRSHAELEASESKKFGSAAVIS